MTGGIALRSVHTSLSYSRTEPGCRITARRLYGALPRRRRSTNTEPISRERAAMSTRPWVTVATLASQRDPATIAIRPRSGMRHDVAQPVLWIVRSLEKLPLTD